MRRTLVSLSTLGALLLGTTAAAQAPASEMDTHIAAASVAAGLDYRSTFVNLCFPGANPALARAGGGGPAAGRGTAGRGAGGAASTPDRANWYAPPFKVFDNLYWLGTRQHSSWALQTSAGIIIIDTNFAWATQPEIIDGLTTLGLNPRDIKYVIISHAHGDHDQGAAELQRRYGAKVVMGAADWDATLQRPATAAGGVPKRDIAVGPEGTKLTLGDTTVTIVATPGHTPGHAVLRLPGERPGAHRDGGLFRRHADRRLRRRRRALGRIHRLAAEDRQGGRRRGRRRSSSRITASTTAPTRRRGWCRCSGRSARTIRSSSAPDGVQRYFTVMAECAMASKLRNGAK